MLYLLDKYGIVSLAYCLAATRSSLTFQCPFRGVPDLPERACERDDAQLAPDYRIVQISVLYCIDYLG